MKVLGHTTLAAWNFFFYILSVAMKCNVRGTLSL